MELDKFVEQLKGLKVEPTKQVWNRLEVRLKETRVRQSLKIFKYLAAASFIGLLGISFLYVEHVYFEHTSSRFAAYDEHTSIILEELSGDTHTESVYSITNVINLHNAYKQFSTESLKVNK